MISFSFPHDPACGPAFTSEDPMGFAAGDINLFRYCGNDPVDRTDPDGMMSLSAWSRAAWNHSYAEVRKEEEARIDAAKNASQPAGNSDSNSIARAPEGPRANANANANANADDGIQRQEMGVWQATVVRTVIAAARKLFQKIAATRQLPKNFIKPTNPPQMPPSSLPSGAKLFRERPSPGYENGHWKIEKFDGQGMQRLDPRTMRTGPHQDTHVPFPRGYKGPYDN